MVRSGGVKMAAVVVAAFLGGALVQLVAPGGLTAQAQEQSKPQIVTAEAFRLVDPAGQELASLQRGADGVSLTIQGTDGKTQAIFGAVRMPHVPDVVSWGMLLRDDQGRDRFIAGRAGNGGGGMACWDENGKMRVALGGGTVEQGVGMVLSDSAGTERLAAGVGPGVGGADFALKDQAGNGIWRASQHIKPAE